MYVHIQSQSQKSQKCTYTFTSMKFNPEAKKFNPGAQNHGCERAFLLSFFLPAAAHRFLDKFLVWKINVSTRPTVPLAGCQRVTAHA